MQQSNKPNSKKTLINTFKSVTYFVNETFRKLLAESDPMRDAIKNGKEHEVEFLLKKGADPNKIERSWCTPLVLSISYKQYACSLKLLKNCADPNKLFSDGDQEKSPLQLCFDRNDASLIRLLILFGASVSNIFYDKNSQALLHDVAVETNTSLQNIKKLHKQIQKAESMKNWNLIKESYEKLNEKYIDISKLETVEALKQYYEGKALKYRNLAIAYEEKIYSNSFSNEGSVFSYSQILQSDRIKSSNLKQPLISTVDKNSTEQPKLKIA